MTGIFAIKLEDGSIKIMRYTTLRDNVLDLDYCKILSETTYSPSGISGHIQDLQDEINSANSAISVAEDVSVEDQLAILKQRILAG